MKQKNKHTSETKEREGKKGENKATAVEKKIKCRKKQNKKRQRERPSPAFGPPLQAGHQPQGVSQAERVSPFTAFAPILWGGKHYLELVWDYFHYLKLLWIFFAVEKW